MKNQFPDINRLYDDAVALLLQLIEIPSPSRGEDATATAIECFLNSRGIKTHRSGNNVWAFNRHYDGSKPTILLNSHHDTVRPNNDYSRDPFAAAIEGDRLYGLGSNDAGASIVALISAFLYFYEIADLKYNLCLAITAEEEVGGANGIESIIPKLGEPVFAIVGEPTGMQLAIAERGLMVVDCTAHGKSGHAAREEGDNAIYRAIEDIEWFRRYKFPKVSDMLGEVKMNVTVIKAGFAHNVIPAECDFTVDIRVTDRYTNEEVLAVIRRNVKCDVKPRSMRLKPSSISPEHTVVKAGTALGLSTYGSPTISDQSLLNIPSVKVGPGLSERSHMADEYVLLGEIREGIELYIKILDRIL